MTRQSNNHVAIYPYIYSANTLHEVKQLRREWAKTRWESCPESLRSPPKKVSYQSATSHSYLFLGRVQVIAAIRHQHLHETSSVNKKETTQAKRRETRTRYSTTQQQDLDLDSEQRRPKFQIIQKKRLYFQTKIFMPGLTGYERFCLRKSHYLQSPETL